MQDLYLRDPAGFIDYALRDALIYLGNALWLEEFQFGYGGIGRPLSLSAIGRKYVKVCEGRYNIPAKKFLLNIYLEMLRKLWPQKVDMP
jgi:hypothetical protein